MSTEVKTKTVTVNTVLKLKSNNEKITMLTAYDYSTARAIDESGVETILVGDSLGMTDLGYDNTLSVTMEDMLVFTKAVARGTKRAMIIADMPFMSYHVSKEEAIKNAGELVRAGAQAVKLEGASDHITDIVKHLTSIGIAVVGHIGFTPQYINSLGGYVVQGKSFENTLRLFEEAKKLEQAGAFMIVMEMVPEETTKYITENISIPTIGIGAGKYASGQVLVLDDILGRYPNFTPKFAKQYASVKDIILDCASKYNEDVKSVKFPEEKHTFNLKPEELKKVDDYFNK